MRGMLAVTLGLIGLQVLLTSPINELVPAVSYLTTVAAKWIDPTVPLIGDHSASQQPAAAPSKLTPAADNVGKGTAGLLAR